MRSLRALEVIARKSRDNAAEWGDLDECLRRGFDELGGRADKLAAEIEEVYPGRPRRNGREAKATTLPLDQQELPLD